MRRLWRMTFVSMLTLASATALGAEPKGKGKKGSAKKKAKTEKVEAAAESSAPAAAGNEYKAPYGTAGCGLGSMVIKSGGFMQVFAATLNSTGVQTFGITTGTSNCKAGKEAAMAEQQVFMESNFASLSKEAAQGTGEHLTALAELLGCDHTTFAEASREYYGELYNSDQATQVLENHRRHFSQSCARAVL